MAEIQRERTMHGSRRLFDEGRAVGCWQGLKMGIVIGFGAGAIVMWMVMLLMRR